MLPKGLTTRNPQPLRNCQLSVLEPQ